MRKQRTTNDGRQTEGELAPDGTSADELSADELSAQIDDLDARIERLGAYLDARREELQVGELCRLLDLHSKMLERVTRMRQAQKALEGKRSVLVEATHKVLDAVAKKKGARL